eukprot:SAG25_NODE_24_length_22161_cov_23.692405_26_plen_219_part_00
MSSRGGAEYISQHLPKICIRRLNKTLAAQTPVAPLPRKPKFATPQQRPTPHPTPLLIGSLLPWDRTVSSWPWVPRDHPGDHPPPTPATNAAASTTRPCRTARSRTPRPVHAHGRRGCYALSEGRLRCPSRTGGTSAAAWVVTSSSGPRLRRTEYPLYHSAAGPPDLDQRVGRAAGIGVPAAVASRPPWCVLPEISADCLPIRRLRRGRLRRSQAASAP